MQGSGLGGFLALGCHHSAPAVPVPRQSANTEVIYASGDSAPELTAQGGRWGSENRNSALIY